MSKSCNSEMAESFTSCAKYEEPVEYGGCAARHDEIFAGCDPDGVSVEDTARLKELGWTANDEDCFSYMT